jgi:predicted HTH transcriptional regulator
LQLNILKEIQKNKKITYNILCEILNKNRTTIMRNISKLKKKGILKRVGSDKTGYWKIIKK